MGGKSEDKRPAVLFINRKGERGGGKKTIDEREKRGKYLMFQDNINRVNLSCSLRKNTFLVWKGKRAVTDGRGREGREGGEKLSFNAGNFVGGNSGSRLFSLGEEKREAGPHFRKGERHVLIQEDPSDFGKEESAIKKKEETVGLVFGEKGRKKKQQVEGERKSRSDLKKKRVL